VEGYVEGAWGAWVAAQAAAQGEELRTPVNLQPRIWFNSELRSRNYLVPGLVAIIMTLIGALLTALVMAREWERGTMEALMVTPASMSEVLLGKLAAYFILGTGGMMLSVSLAVWLFGVPLRGSFWLLWGCSSLFLLAALGMGLTISTLARSQFVAGQIAIIATFLPAFLLSGFIFDIGSMPPVVQVITHIVVARYFVSIVQTLFLAGNVWSVIVPNALALAAMAALFLGITWRKSRKRLD
jgi:ABC-2 type transport system permease protein